MTPAAHSRYWAIVPAAGAGARMGAAVPKQYLPLLGQTLLEHTLSRLLDLPNLAGLVLVISPEDTRWDQLSLSKDSRISVVDGGRERSESVLNGLNYLALHAAADDWILVHDAARPCVRISDILNLCEQTRVHPVGGILGIPVVDTLKQVNGAREIINTPDRSILWQAQTPQLFRYQLLHQYLARALTAGHTVTDEASAVEAGGHRPLIVEGHSDNIKITRPEDLILAEMILQQQETP